MAQWWREHIAFAEGLVPSTHIHSKPSREYALFWPPRAPSMHRCRLKLVPCTIKLKKKCLYTHTLKRKKRKVSKTKTKQKQKIGKSSLVQVSGLS